MQQSPEDQQILNDILSDSDFINSESKRNRTQKVELNITSIDVKVTIKSINENGLVTIEFSKDMYVPKNYTKFDSNVLNIQYFQASLTENTTTPVDYLWKVTEFTPRQLYIQMLFSDPLLVS